MEKNVINKSLKTKVSCYIIGLFSVGLIACSLVGIVNVKSFGNKVMKQDLENGRISGQKALEEYFFGIEFRMDTMERTGIIQKDYISKEFTNTKMLLSGLKGTTDVITSTVFRADNINVSIPENTDNSIVIEDKYYEEALKEDKIWVGPYINKKSGKETLSVYKVVKEGEKAIGVIGMDIDFNDISVFFSEVGFSSTGYSMLISNDGTILSNGKYTETVHKKVEQEEINDLIKSNGDGYGETSINGVDYKMQLSKVEKTNWNMISLISKDEYKGEYRSVLYTQVALSLVILIGSGIIVWILAGRIVDSIKLIMLELQKVGEGDLSGHIDTKTGDEREEVANAYNKMVRDFKGLISGTKDSVQILNHKNESLNGSLGELKNASEQISQAMLQIAQVSNEQARETDKVVSEVDELSTSMEGVSDSIDEMHKLCTELEKVSRTGAITINNLVIGAGESKTATNNINVSVRNVEESSREIEGIIVLINQISSQTNLLALNAAIEAARVGEQGKGFAVVADEIRSLAEQSKTATDKIQDIISNMQFKIEETVNNIDSVNEVMNVQDENVRETEQSFEEIYMGIQNINDGILKIEGLNKNMLSKKSGIYDSIQSLAAGIEETSASNEEVTAFAESQLHEVEKASALSNEVVNINENLVGKVRMFK